MQTCYEKVKHLDPCDEAVDWMGDRTSKQVWDEAPSSCWLLWWTEKCAGQEGWVTKREYLTFCKEILEKLSSTIPSTISVDNYNTRASYINKPGKAHMILDGLTEEQQNKYLPLVRRRLRPSYL